MLDQVYKNNAVYRIVSGETICTINKEQYLIKNPTARDRYRAELLYQKIVDENKYEPWITKDGLFNILVNSGLWTVDGDINLNKIEKRIDDLKVDLYKNIWNVTKQKSIRKELGLVRNKQREMLGRKHCYDYLTVEGFAETIKMQYLLYCSTYNCSTETKLWESFDSIDYYILENIVSFLNDIRLNIEEIREIARTDPWKTMWSASKEQVFGCPALEWSDEQKTLVMFSKMYDNIYASPECPTDMVIHDDDLLDGWLILEKRKRDAEASKNKISHGKQSNKSFDTSEFFVPAKNKEQINEIYRMNDIEGQIAHKQRSQALKAHGKLEASKLPDNTVLIQQKVLEQIRDKK